MGRVSSFFADGVLAAASLTLALLLLEAGLHVSTGDRYRDIEHRLRFGNLVYEPNQKKRWKRPEWDVEYSINARGFRDAEPESCPRAGNALFLGDSFVEGYGVDLSGSMVKRLEGELRKDGHPHRVYNGGIQGRSPHGYLRVYKDFFKDDKSLGLVLLGFFVGNDVETAPASGYVAPPDRLALSYRAKRFLGEHSVLYNFLRRPVKLSRGLNAFLVRRGLLSPTWVLDPNTFSRSSIKHWRYTAGLLRSFDSELKAGGLKLVLVLIPQKEQVEDDYYAHVLRATETDPKSIDRFALNDYLAEFGRREGLAVLDLTPAFREADQRRPGGYYFKMDSHWNARGQALAAGEVFRYLKGRGLLTALERLGRLSPCR